jgi:hypothetical protein
MCPLDVGWLSFRGSIDNSKIGGFAGKGRSKLTLVSLNIAQATLAPSSTATDAAPHPGNVCCHCACSADPCGSHSTAVLSCIVVMMRFLCCAHMCFVLPCLSSSPGSPPACPTGWWPRSMPSWVCLISTCRFLCTLTKLTSRGVIHAVVPMASLVEAYRGPSGYPPPQIPCQPCQITLIARLLAPPALIPPCVSHA